MTATMAAPTERDPKAEMWLGVWRRASAKADSINAGFKSYAAFRGVDLDGEPLDPAASPTSPVSDGSTAFAFEACDGEGSCAHRQVAAGMGR